MSVDETKVKLIELFTQPKQLVCDPAEQFESTRQSALSVDREFIHDFSLANHVANNSTVDFLLTEIPLLDFKSLKNIDEAPCFYEQSLQDFQRALSEYRTCLKSTAYAAFIVSDQRFQQRYYCRHADIVQCFQHNGFALQGLINVIRDSQALNAYGYPHTYVPNIINQFVIIARRL